MIHNGCPSSLFLSHTHTPHTPYIFPQTGDIKMHLRRVFAVKRIHLPFAKNVTQFY